jgi:hypothetical protein
MDMCRAGSANRVGAIPTPTSMIWLASDVAVLGMETPFSTLLVVSL